MSLIAPIGPVRVAGIRPAAPAPGDDPYEDGLCIQLVTEPAATAVGQVDTVTAAASSNDPQLDLTRRALEATATATIAPSSLADPARVVTAGTGGNCAVSTGYEQRPASNLGDAPRGEFASPFARAMAANSVR